jgi:hypothetical protein
MCPMAKGGGKGIFRNISKYFGGEIYDARWLRWLRGLVRRRTIQGKYTGEIWRTILLMRHPPI